MLVAVYQRRRSSRADVIHSGIGGGSRGVGHAGQLTIVAEVVQFSPQAGLMSVRVNGQVYLLDKDDLAMVGAVLVRLVAEGTQVTPTMISTILRRDP